MKRVQRGEVYLYLTCTVTLLFHMKISNSDDNFFKLHQNYSLNSNSAMVGDVVLIRVLVVLHNVFPHVILQVILEVKYLI